MSAYVSVVKGTGSHRTFVQIVDSNVTFVQYSAPAKITRVTEGMPGPVGPQGPPGNNGIGADITEHVNSPEPHPPYDDMLDLTLIFENGLV